MNTGKIPYPFFIQYLLDLRKANQELYGSR